MPKTNGIRARGSRAAPKGHFPMPTYRKRKANTRQKHDSSL
jgi:hypothetical protein